jgi:cell growth-regulating nucleolar protein
VVPSFRALIACKRSTALNTDHTRYVVESFVSLLQCLLRRLVWSVTVASAAEWEDASDQSSRLCVGIFLCIHLRLPCSWTNSDLAHASKQSCISEAQKYQGALFKDKKKPQKQSPRQHQPHHSNAVESSATTEARIPQTETALVKMSTMVEEVHQSTSLAIVDAPPRAPSPPPAPLAINVFDFLDRGEDDGWEDEDDMNLDRPNTALQVSAYQTDGFAYGSGTVPSSSTKINSAKGKRGQQNGNNYATPAPRKGRSKNSPMDSSTAKKSSKRKFAHVDDLDLTRSGPDVIMTDVTPSGFAHSGLTGSINKLMSRAFPSPDPSGDGHSPTSPVKRSRKDRSSERDRDRRDKKVRRKSDSDKEKMEGSKRKKHKTEGSTPRQSRDKKVHSRHDRRTGRRRSASPDGVTKQHALSLSPPDRYERKQMKAIEYHPSSDVEDMSKALVKVEHAPTTKSVDTFLSCLVKGSETDQGVSVWRALKRWKKQGGSGDQEKELWKELKIRSNERGELVICI